MTDPFIEQLGDAQAHWRRGATDEARGVYQSILQQDPDCLEALLQLGHLEREHGQLEAAATLHARAAELSGDAIAYTALGRTLGDDGQAQAAADAFLAALRADRNYAPAYQHLGELFGRLGDVERAHNCFVNAVRLDPRDPYARHNLGISSQLVGKKQEAPAHFRAALEINPAYSHSWQALGDFHRQAGDLSQALACYEKLVALESDTDNLLRLGATRQLLGQFDEAVRIYRQILEREPDHQDAVYNLATCCQATGELDQAARLFGEVLKKQPGHVSAAAGLAGVHDRRGDYDKGLSLLRPMMATAGANAELWVSLGRLARHAGQAAEILPDLEAALERESFGDIDRSRVAFTAGALRDAVGDYDAAFRHFQLANRLKPHAYQRDVFENAVERLIDVFDRRTIERLRNDVRDEPRPVFIVGMPRSGSTLLEQILISHPQVASIGESPLLSQTAFTLGSSESPYPDCIANCSAEQIATAAERYRDALPADRPNVTDKMLSNLAHIGLIGMFFPDARIVHCVRHPLDTLLSCYSHDFVGAQVSFAYDFDDLAHYYRQYRRLMNHWSDVEALSTISASYEDIVGDTDNTIRSILDFLGLPWDPNCLTFHENDSIPNTASYAQVRRPIYPDSVGRHEHYREQLRPLAEAVSEFLPSKQ